MSRSPVISVIIADIGAALQRIFQKPNTQLIAQYDYTNINSI